MRLFWGLLILSIGLIFLGQTFALWGPEQISKLAQFWPLLLILLGIAIMVRHLKLGWLIILIGFLVALAFVYLASFSSFSPNKTFLNRQEEETYNFSEDITKNIKSAKIVVDTGAVSLNISEPSNKLFEGTLESRYFKPQLDVSTENGIATIHFKTTRLGGWWGKNKLNLKISNKIPVDLTINTGASNLDLNFEKLAIVNFNLNCGASSIEMKFGKMVNGSTVNISAGASSIKISAPKDSGIKIVSKTGLSSKDFQGLKETTKNTFENDNYKLKSTKKIEIAIDAGVSSIEFMNY